MAEKRRVRLRLRWEWVPLALVFVAALAFRLRLRYVSPFVDEPGFFYVSRTLGGTPPNVDDVFGPLWYYPGTPYFWERPLYYLITFPTARISFDAYRLENIAIASLLPVLLVLILRGRNVRSWIAYPAGLLVAAHPVFIKWGAISLMDTHMTVLFAAAILAADRGKPIVSGILMLAAIWVKESAIWGLGALLLLSLWEGHRNTTTKLWPLHLNRLQSIYLLVLPVGLFPLNYAAFIGLYAPGGPAETTYGRALLDSLFVSAWLIPLLLLGLRWDRTRSAALLGLFYPVFYLTLHLAFNRGFREWYLPQPAFLAVLGAAVVLDEASKRWRASEHPLRRMFPPIPVALALILLAGLVLPASAAKSLMVNPASQARSLSLAEFYESEDARDQVFWDAWRAMNVNASTKILAVDVWGGFVLWPLATNAAAVRTGYTDIAERLQQRTEPWANATESFADVTIIAKNSQPVNRALRDVYHDCMSHENAMFEVLRSHACAGRADALAARVAAIRAGSA